MPSIQEARINIAPSMRLRGGRITACAYIGDDIFLVGTNAYAAPDDEERIKVEVWRLSTRTMLYRFERDSSTAAYEEVSTILRLPIRDVALLVSAETRWSCGIFTLLSNHYYCIPFVILRYLA